MSEVVAQTLKVQKLLSEAQRYHEFREQRSRPLSRSLQDAIDRVAIALAETHESSVTLSADDLASVRRSREAWQRINCSPLRKFWQAHCFAAWISVLSLPDMLIHPLVAIAAPVVVLYFFTIVPAEAALTLIIGRKAFGSAAIMEWIAIHLVVRYLIIFGPSLMLARNYRHREFDWQICLAIAALWLSGFLLAWFAIA